MSDTVTEKGYSENTDRILPSQHLANGPHTTLADAAPLGLFSFAATAFTLSMYNAGAKSVSEPNVVVGMALFTGGLTQLLAGMWEMARGNTFGATAFSLYGAFWGSYATILLPGAGIRDAYPDETMFNNAIGIYLLAWVFITFFLLVASFRTNIGLTSIVVALFVTFLLLAIGSFTGKVGVTKAAGVTGVITATLGFYVGFAALISSEQRPLFRAPVGAFKAE